MTAPPNQVPSRVHTAHPGCASKCHTPFRPAQTTSYDDDDDDDAQNMRALGGDTNPSLHSGVTRPTRCVAVQPRRTPPPPFTSVPQPWTGPYAAAAAVYMRAVGGDTMWS